MGGRKSEPAFLVVTAGCPSGLGPLVVAGALAALDLREQRVTVVGAAEPVLRALRGAGIRKKPMVVDAPTRGAAGLFLVDTAAGAAVKPGVPDASSDAAAARALDLAVDAAVRGEADAVATGPVRKQAFDRVKGGPFPGHTELFHHFLGVTPKPVMFFVAPAMRLALHTIHVPLKGVPALVTRELVGQSLEVLLQGLKLLGVKSPRVDVLGLNPHAGEEGRLGTEERDHVAPAIEDSRAKGHRVEGPFPADGYMARYGLMRAKERPDAVLAMFHDQGLAPFKLIEKRQGFQMTLGLRVPRTSCDHGTAYDVALSGGPADSRSMAAALSMAGKLAVGRRWGP